MLILVNVVAIIRVFVVQLLCRVLYIFWKVAHRATLPFGIYSRIAIVNVKGKRMYIYKYIILLLYTYKHLNCHVQYTQRQIQNPFHLNNVELVFVRLVIVISLMSFFNLKLCIFIGLARSNQCCCCRVVVHILSNHFRFEKKSTHSHTFKHSKLTLHVC